MQDVLESVIEYGKAVADRISVLESAACGADGCLSANRKDGRVYYILRKTADGKCFSKYLSAGDREQIRRSAEGKYAKLVLPCLRSNLKAAKAFIALHSGLEENDAAKKLDPAFIEHCSGLYVPREIMVKEWLDSKPADRLPVAEEPSVLTVSGEYVRSKSEAIISNSLFRHDLVFLYEKPLFLEKSGFTVFPDFTILDPAVMEEIYWEHFGMMDSPEYLRSALRKISNYIRNGIIPGKNLICTFETLEQPLSSFDVEQLIKAFLLH